MGSTAMSGPAPVCHAHHPTVWRDVLRPAGAICKLDSLESANNRSDRAESQGHNPICGGKVSKIERSQGE